MRNYTRPSTRRFLIAGTIVALFLAGFASYYASAKPDGLTKVAGDIVPGIAAQERPHARGDSTFSGYSTEGVANDRLSGAIAGVVGVSLTLGVSGVLFFVIRSRGSGSARATARNHRS